MLKAITRNLTFTIFVCTFLFSAVPSLPNIAGTCEVNNKTAEICVSWLKPVGGNEIDNYIVQWKMVKDHVEHSEVILYNGMESNTYTISNIGPAQTVNVSIRASNFAGESGTSWQIYATGKYFQTMSCWLAHFFGAISFYLYLTFRHLFYAIGSNY